MRRNRHLVFIPQIDADLYTQPNFETLTELDEWKYVEQGYSRLNIEPDDIELNQYLDDKLYPVHSLKQTRAVKSFCQDAIARYGPPFLAFDYHEGPSNGKFDMFQYRARAPPSHPLYVYAEVAKSYPVINEPELAESQDFRNDFVLTPDNATSFSSHLACKSGYGFTFEAPKEENGYSLHQRIEMNLIATDRILARYYLGL